MNDDQPISKISDVALLAGVSVATVSRVIHNSGVVSEETRKRVEEAVQQLGYQARRAPRASAPAAVTEKIVLLVTGDIVNPFFAEVIRGTQEEIDLQQHALSIMQLSGSYAKLVKRPARCP